MTAEIWKDISGYEGRYQASSAGEIRSLVYSGKLRAEPKILKQVPDSRDGYLVVSLYSANPLAQRTVKVHQIVTEAFKGERPKGMFACHDDDDYLNNAASNLRWDTPNANQIDRVKNGTSNHGSRNGNTSLTEESVLKIKARLKDEIGTKGLAAIIAKDFFVSRQAINHIQMGRSWSHL